MPGKVNPVLPEVVLQVGAQVIGNDTAITIGGLQGQFELNVRIPLIARNLLQSIALLSSASRAVRREVRRRDRAQPAGPRGLGRGHAGRRHRAEPVHRLRQGRRDRQGGRGLRRHAARGRPQARRRRGDAGQGARPAQDRRGFLCLISTPSRRTTTPCRAPRHGRRSAARSRCSSGRARGRTTRGPRLGVDARVHRRRRRGRARAQARARPARGVRVGPRDDAVAARRRARGGPGGARGAADGARPRAPGARPSRRAA